MKIAQLAPIWYPVPPRGYGGIELVVHLLTEGLVERGHEVTLFASGDSETKATLCSIYDNGPCELIGKVYPDLIHVMNAYYNHEGEFDIIHDHSGMIGPAIGGMTKTPVLHTLHGPATENAIRLYKMMGTRVYFNSISDYQRSQFGDLNFVGTVYNAVDQNKYHLEENKEDYLLFLARMNPQKGAHIAVQVANKMKMKLKMVTKISEPAEKEYFSKTVAPIINEKYCEIIGEIDIKLKALIYRKAKCLLMPIQWPEPFGLTMVEAMLSGTPVIAIRAGSVPEIIADGKTGYIVDNSVDEICEAIKKIDKIKPADCRNHAIENFSVEKNVTRYEETYQSILDIEKGKKTVSILVPKY